MSNPEMRVQVVWRVFIEVPFVNYTTEKCELDILSCTKENTFYSGEEKVGDENSMQYGTDVEE